MSDKSTCNTCGDAGWITLEAGIQTTYAVCPFCNKDGKRSQAPTGIDFEPADLEKANHVLCPQCKRCFILRWAEFSEKPITLIIRGCPSGGVYDVSVSCPHCDYEEAL